MNSESSAMVACSADALALLRDAVGIAGNALQQAQRLA